MKTELASILAVIYLVKAQSAQWGQCGGSGWTGPTTCDASSTCQFYNPWYSECVPVATPSGGDPCLDSASTPSPAWGQCGGAGWTGPTTCAAGSTCTFSNPGYSQCIPGATPSTSPSFAAVATPSTPPSFAAVSGSKQSFLGGVNIAGYDFGVATDGSFTGAGVSPDPAQFAHFSAQGANLFRIPFAWQLMTPNLGDTIDPNFFAEFDATVKAALATGANVILDLHNYARWYGGVIGQGGGPTNAQFASIWKQLATKYASNSKIIFGIMNEPHDLPQGTAPWADSVQAAVNAIRAAGATSQIILIPGASWSSAQSLPTEAGPDLLKVTDPVGDASLLVFDVHKYLDFDSSGTHAECVTDNVGVLKGLVSWLKANNRQALLSETGGGNTASCETNLASELSFVKSNSGRIIGFAVWSAGAFPPSYTLGVTPNPDGSDQPVWIQAVRPNLP